MKTKNNTLEIKIGKIQDQIGDVALNWATIHLNNKSFYEIIRISGIQPLDAINTFKLNIQNGSLMPGDVLSTIPGLLKYNLLLHCFIPDNGEYNMSWLNVIKTLKKYKEENILRTVYLAIPQWEFIKDFISNFFTYETMIEGIEFIFLVSDNNEKTTLHNILEKYGESYLTKIPLMDKVDTFFKNIIGKISKDAPSKLIWKDAHKQKKLQKSIKRT